MIARAKGWRPDTPDINDHRRMGAAHLTDAPLPPSVDLRQHFPPCYDQTTLNSCVANAVLSVVQYNRRTAGQSDFNPSRLFTYFGAREREGTIASDCGVEVRDGIKDVVEHGVCSEDHWPYDPRKFSARPDKLCYDIATHHLVGGYSRVDQTERSIQSCLAAQVPVVFGFQTYPFFDSDEVAATGTLRLPRPGETATGGHAVVACGYRPGSEGVLVRNSWGLGWGLPWARGHFLMPWAYILDNDLSDDLWTIEASS